MPRIAIQTPLYRSSAYLPMLIQSLQAQTYTDWKFYACENSGDPAERARVQALLQASGIPYHLEESQHNLGFAGGHNMLMQRHQDEFIMLLNEDAYVDSHHLEQCIARFEADSSCASVTGIVYRWSGPVDQAERLTDETLIDTTAHAYGCLAHVIDRDAGCTWGKAKARLQEPHTVFGAQGAVSMFRRAHVEAVGPDKLLFPPFFMYREDVDLTLRLRRKGFTSWFDPSVMSFHRRSFKSFASLWDRLQDERSRPASLRIASYRNLWWLLIYHASWSLGLADIIKSVAQVFALSLLTCFASPSVFIQAAREVMKGIPAALQRRRALVELGLPYVRFYSSTK